MARDGGNTRKSKVSTLKHPDPDSKTSRRRRNRGFKSLEASCRIHKRAARRQADARVFNGKTHEPGEKAYCASGPNPRKEWLYTAGGAIKFY
jgi:hypothetical protein